MSEVVQQVGEDSYERQQDNANITLFLKEAIGSDYLNQPIREDEVRVGVDVMLELNRQYGHRPDYKDTPPSTAKMFGSLDKVHAGLPLTRGEVSAIIEGPKKRFYRSGDHKKSTYQRLEGYLDDAEVNLGILKAVEEVWPGHERQVDLDKLRFDRQAQYLLGDLLYARERLYHREWPARTTRVYKERQSFWRGCVLVAAMYGEPKLLGKVSSELLDSAEQRFRFWSRSMQEINRGRGSLAVRKELLGPESPDSLEIGKPKAVEPLMSSAEREPTEYHIPVHIVSPRQTSLDRAAARIENDAEQGSSYHASSRKEAGGGQIIFEDGKARGAEVAPARVSARAQAVHAERQAKSKKMRDANARRRWDTGPSDKAKGEH